MPPPDGEIERLYRRVREEPRSVAFVALADALRHEGRLAEGLRVLREGFRVHPDHPAGQMVLARIHVEIGNRPLALEVLADVVRTDPENLAAVAQLARLHAADGRWGEAEPLVARLREAGHPDGRARELSPLPRASEASEVDPFESPSAALRLARRGAYDRAWRMLERARRREPSLEAQAAGAAVAQALAGCGDVPGEPARGEGRGALPGLEEAFRALLGAEQDQPPPAGDHPVASWGRRIWRAP